MGARSLVMTMRIVYRSSDERQEQGVEVGRRRWRDSSLEACIDRGVGSAWAVGSCCGHLFYREEDAEGPGNWDGEDFGR
jgi:hypothetical protein